MGGGKKSEGELELGRALMGGWDWLHALDRPRMHPWEADGFLTLEAADFPMM